MSITYFMAHQRLKFAHQKGKKRKRDRAKERERSEKHAKRNKH